MRYFFFLLLLLVNCSQQPVETIDGESPDRGTNGITATATMAGPTATPATAEEAALHGVLNWTAERATDERSCNEQVESGEEERCLILREVSLLEKEPWSQLLPDTYFYLVRFQQRTQDEFLDQVTSISLVGWQDGKRYGPGNFDDLLARNGVEISDENRELVAQAFALMTLPNYLTEEIEFRELEAGDWDGRHRYTHRLVGWTKLEGLNVNWWYQFREGNLRLVTRAAVASNHNGDYIEAPYGSLPVPGLVDYTFSP